MSEIRTEKFFFRIPKNLVLKKLSILCMLAFSIQMFAAPSYSEIKKLNIKFRGVTIQEVLAEIENQSEFEFFYNHELLDITQQEVNINLKDVTIDKVLDRLFNSREVSYKIDGKHIIIVARTKKRPSNKSPAMGLQQPVAITGTVTDAETGEPLPGANIVCQGTTMGTVTDMNGNYTVQVPEDAMLVFSFVGYEEQVIDPAGRNEIDVALQPTLVELDEVVAIGYGERKRRDISGSIGSVTGEQLEKMTPSSSPELALQGSVPGIRVLSGGGHPFTRNEIRIRGINTWGVASPLIIVDGIPITEYGSGAEGSGYRGSVNIMTLINPSDIESISVLKDAAAAAIYGVRASNGVILIETKTGEEATEPIQIDFSAQYGIKNYPEIYDVLNVDQYVDLYTEAHNNNPTQALEPELDPSSAVYMGNLPTVDWQTPLLNENAANQTYNLRLSGSTAQTDYAFSAGYTKNESPIINNGLQRYNISSKAQSQFSNILKAGINLQGIWEDVDDNSYRGGREGILAYAARHSPWQPIYNGYQVGPYWQDGVEGYASAIASGIDRAAWDPTRSWHNMDNTLGKMAINSNTHHIYRVLGKLFVELQPIKGLSIRGRISGDYYTDRRVSFQDVDYFMFDEAAKSPLDEFGAAAVDDSEGEYGEEFSTNYNLMEELIIRYGRSLGEHNFNVLLIGSHQDYGYRNIWEAYDALNYEDEVYWGIINQNAFLSGESYRAENAVQGYVGRIDYNFANKYYIDFTLRYDGSSKFAPENRWDYFPGFSAAWRLSEEDFMGGLGWLTDLKLFGGWGKLGNHEIKDYGYVGLANENATVSLGYDGGGRRLGMGYTYWGVGFNDMPNESLGWEKTYTTNVGFDLLLFNALSARLELFTKTTEDLLTTVEVPESVGLNNPPFNLGEVLNRGMDLQLGYRDQVGEVWYSIHSNLSLVNNEVTLIKDGVPFGGDQNRVREGFPLFYLRGYQVAGMFQAAQEVTDYQSQVNDVNTQASLVSPGDLYFKDVRGTPEEEGQLYTEGSDGVVNEYDKVFIGKTIPGFTYGFNISAGYKGFDIFASFYGEGDVQAVNDELQTFTGMEGNNQWPDVLDRWTPTNTNTDIPRAVIGDPASNNRFSDRWVEDASYFRGQTVQIGYTLPSQALNKMGIGRRIRVYLSGMNLFTITNWSGLDVATAHTGGLPNPRTFSIGVNATF